MNLKLLPMLLLVSALPLIAQTNRPTLRPRADGRAISTNTYSTDLATVLEAQAQAIDQAREALDGGEGVRDRDALRTAITAMEEAQAALNAAKDSPEKLPAALAAEQTAYQALLKVVPREYRMSRSQGGGQNGSAGQASQQQMNELDLPREQNRYETERQASTPQTARQREQSQTANRLRELSQRQQDLNERLRELQTALQAAQTEEQREELQRQLKRLQDEQRQMLANVDELRQQLAGSSAEAETQRQLEQARSEMERAAQAMDRQSPSSALAAGARAQEQMQNLRDSLRQQTSSQFSDQLRELRQQARELEQRQEQAGKSLDSLARGERQALDNTAERQQILDQLGRQQQTLTNLLANLREVTEQSETTEPLLSRQLYDTLRRADQLRLEDLLDLTRELTGRGFLPQAGQAEQVARTNLLQFTRSLERAADAVLGSEADALRFAQRELDELIRQAERDSPASGPNLSPGRRSTSGAQQSSQSPSPSPETGAKAQAGGSNPGDNEGAPREASGGAPSPDSRPQSGPTEASPSSRAEGNGRGRSNSARLGQWVEQFGGGDGDGGPLTGDNYQNWTERLRDVEDAVSSADLRNQLAVVRERASVLRGEFRERGQIPDSLTVREKLILPLNQVRSWLREELARKEKSDALVPLDRDPVPDHYSELVRKYYEKLGSAR
ncbi:MAG: hypothetical protein U1F65_03540 [Verrucomicrobiota bacterium]